LHTKHLWSTHAWWWRRQSTFLTWVPDPPTPESSLFVSEKWGFLEATLDQADS
jgi:hypothetical protein